MFNSEKFSFLAILFVLASTIAFTSCNDDEMVDPNPDMVVCDSFAVDVTGNDSILFANVFGGTEPFIYAWSEGSTTDAINIFATGDYSVTVTDVNGCTSEGTITIDEVEEPVDDCEDFTGSISEDNGTLTAESTGGTEPYTYIWNDSLTTTQTIEATENGTYWVYITDANGCTTSASYGVETVPCSGFSVEINVSPDSLNNINTYILNGYPNGGTSPFLYTWNEGSTDAILYEVTSGTYSVTVIDANGCEAEDEVVID